MVGEESTEKFGKGRAARKEKRHFARKIRRKAIKEEKMAEDADFDAMLEDFKVIILLMILKKREILTMIIFIIYY